MNPISLAIPADADSRLATLVKHHWGRARELTTRLRNAGFSDTDPPAWNTLPRVAVLKKSTRHEIQGTGADLGGFVWSDLQPAAWFWSPGAVMEPLTQHAVERLADLLIDIGFAKGDRVLNGFAYHFTPAGLLFHEALRRIGATVLPIGPQQTAQAAEFAATAAATGFVGASTHLASLMSEVDRLPVEIQRPPLRLAIAGGEPFGHAVRREIAERWGVVCFDMYGFAEAGVVAVECTEHQGLHVHPALLWELQDPSSGMRTADGEPGELVVSLDADELPLLRFATGDLVRLETQPCACGRSAPRLVIHGRVGDSARVRGMLLHGSQMSDFARRAGALAAVRTVIRRNGDRDQITVCWRGAEGRLPAPPDLMGAAFRESCLLRADVFQVDPDLQIGQFLLVDERGDQV